MINSIPNTKEIDKIIRNELITQSELDGKFVRNALSEYGIDLDKNRLDSVFESIESTDCCILFETQSGNNYDVSLSEEDDTVTYYKSFKIKIITYGDISDEITPKLVARFRTERVRNNLYNEGIYIESISNPIQLDEFVNGVIWKRWDFEIDISVRFEVNQISTYSDFDALNKININTI